LVNIAHHAVGDHPVTASISTSNRDFSEFNAR
jgi:hypothetical protein